MKSKNAALKEKEQAQKIKELREELVEKLEEQLPAELLEDRPKVDVQQVCQLR